MSRRLLALALALALLGAGVAAAEILQRGNLRVAVSADISPHRLPRDGTAPIAVTLSGQVSTTDESLPPRLERLEIDVNRHGRIDAEGLPLCRLHQIQPASNARALAACHSALIGSGSFSALVVLRGQAPYPTRGRLLVFNGREGGRPVLFAHIYATRPLATSFVIVFQIGKLAHGPFGTALVAQLSRALGDWAHLTGIEMTLERRFRYRGKERSYISAGCPAPRGFPGALFPLARTSFRFAGGVRLGTTVVRECKAR
jgi:hypothetical protein